MPLIQNILIRRSPWLFILIWVLLLSGLYFTLSLVEHDRSTIIHGIFIALTTHWWGVFVFLGASAVRPLVWFPISLFAVFSGALFGLWPGILITMFSALISAHIAHQVGSHLHRLSYYVPTKITTVVTNKYPFMSILSLHLTMLPFDVINYSAGILSVPKKPFFGAVFLGMIPGTLSLTTLGASIDADVLLTSGFNSNTINWFYVLLSILLWLSAMLISQWFRKRRSLSN